MSGVSDSKFHTLALVHSWSTILPPRKTGKKRAFEEEEREENEGPGGSEEERLAGVQE